MILPEIPLLKACEEGIDTLLNLFEVCIGTLIAVVQATTLKEL